MDARRRLATAGDGPGADQSGCRYADPVVYDWPHIQVPTLAFGGAEDVLPGSAPRFQELMQTLARTIPHGNGRVLLLPGLGHVAHLEAPDRVWPPLVAFLKQGLTAQ